MKEALRKVDQVGRIVIPVEQRALTGLTEGARFVSRVERGKLIVESAEDTCPSCGRPKVDAA